MSFGWLVPSGSTPTKCRTSSKLTFLVTFLHPDSQPPLDTNSTVSRFASNTWKSHFFFCEQSYLRARNSVPVLSCEASRCQANSAQGIHSPPHRCLGLHKTLARLEGFIYTSFLKAFHTHIKYADGSSVPLPLSG